MGYEHLFAKPDLALLYDWLQATGELYVNVDRPHCGGLNDSIHFVDSLPDLKQIVSRETHREISIYVFRETQYPIRGTIGDTLLSTALEQIPDNDWFSIVSAGQDALAPWDVVGWGDSHHELREEFARLKGRDVRIGQNPFDRRVDYFDHPDTAWVARFHSSWRDGSIQPPQVSKNWTNYPPFDSAPERYLPHIDFW